MGNKFATYSLVAVHSREAGQVSGMWVQDHVGTLDTAKKAAARTETVNGNVKIAVVFGVNKTGPMPSYHECLVEL